MSDDIKVAAVAAQVYPMLVETCERCDISLSDLLTHMAVKQQMVERRTGAPS